MNSSNAAINDRVHASGFWCDQVWKAATTSALALALLSVLLLVAGQPGQAQTLTTLYSFTGSTDGATPIGGLIFDPQGNLYGATYDGGAYGYGTVFEFTATGMEKVLYSFTGGADGSRPSGDLTLDAQGNLYGTTYFGGDLSGCRGYGCGVVFELTSTGTESVLYTFTGGDDGAYPNGGLLLDAGDNLYGTTESSYVFPPGPATLFEVNASGLFSVIYSFPLLHNGFKSSPFPNGGLLMDSQGNFYGTTEFGGPLGQNGCPRHTGAGCGTIFEISPGGTETVLLDLQYIGATWPTAGLIADAQGNFYGTSTRGGKGHGTVFELTSNGTGKLLYQFTAGRDAVFPESRPVLDGVGNLYGTTWKGGGDGKGAVFEITASGTEKVLYGFNPKKHPGVGINPSGALVLDAQGNLYGMTAGGGAYGYGTVYKLTP